MESEFESANSKTCFPFLDSISKQLPLSAQSVSEWVIHSFRCDVIASPSFASLLYDQIVFQIVIIPKILFPSLSFKRTWQRLHRKQPRWNWSSSDFEVFELWTFRFSKSSLVFPFPSPLSLSLLRTRPWSPFLRTHFPNELNHIFQIREAII